MNSQIPINYSNTYHLTKFPEFLNLISDEPMSATSYDYGFDFDEEELGKELIAPLPAFFENLPDPLIGAEEFDTLYKWFSA